MKFCVKCGKTVAILGSDTDELCPECAAAPPAPHKKPPREPDGDLIRASLSVKDGRLQLLSPEGWLLWSGSASRAHTIQEITGQASRILAIRKRKRK